MSGLKNSDFKFKRWLITLFITFYGSVMMFQEGMDGYVHWQNVYDYYSDLSIQDYFNGLYHILTFSPLSSTNDDMYIHTLSFLVGSVFHLPQLFFTVVAFIYGYFFSGSILKVLRNISRVKFDWLIYGFAFLFLIWKNLDGINTVRTWTGLWVLFYGAISYFETGKRKYIILMFLPPLIHVGYFIMAIPTWIVLFLGVRPRIYPVVFFLSFFLTLNETAVIKNLSITELGEEKTKSYYIGDDTEGYQEQLNKESFAWYYKLSKQGLHKWAINIFAASCIILGFYKKYMTQVEKKLFSIGILTIAISNATWFLFALGNRSAFIGGLFVLASLVLISKRGFFHGSPNYVIIRLILYLCILLFIPFIVFSLSNFVYLFSVFLFAFPFVAWLLPEVNTTLRQVLGWVFQ